jgi:hypothetical protein
VKRLLRPSTRSTITAAEIPKIDDGVLQVCHPLWRGVRSSALAFGDPVLESDDLNDLVGLVDDIAASGASTIVIQGWPPGAGPFAEAASGAGMDVLTVFHSSPAQHGIDGGEAEAVGEMFELRASGVTQGVATVKAGTAQAYRAVGFEVTHLPNRVPVVADVEPATVTEGINVGIFLHPMWRKNVTTQILAAHQLGWTPFVMAEPDVPYLSRNDLTILGELPRTEFLAVQAAMDITLNVTFSECHPMMPMESYRLGVPCLISRASDLFADDPELYEMTSLDRSDDPEAIARAASSLLDHRAEAVERANAALDTLDERAASSWLIFTGRGA